MKFSKNILIFVIVICLLILGGCSRDGAEKETSETIETVGQIDFNKEEIINIGYGISEEPIIPTKEAAIKYAKIILQETLQVDLNDYHDYTIFFDDQKNIWVISFYYRDYLGGDINIAIKKNNGEVILIWHGE